MTSKPVYLKPRGAAALVPWEEIAVDAAEVGPQTRLEEAQFVALDVETTGNAPFLVLEMGAERFTLERPLSFFDTLVDCRAPINPYARKRHHIDRSMLIGAPEFKDARRAFLRFAHGAVLVEHSHDAFDTWLVGRGLESPLEHPIIDTTALARLVLDLPKGQTPGLARLVSELGLDVTPAHAALDDARATAMVFRALIARAREKLGWSTVGDVLAALPRPVVDRTAPSRRASAASRAQGVRARTAPPQSAAPAATPRATSRAPTVRNPIARSLSSVFGPSPGITLIGSGARKSASVPGGTSTRPSGLRVPLATLATSFDVAAPTDAVKPTSVWTWNLIRRATSSAVEVPWRVRAVTSRYASSRATPSTSSGEVKRRKIWCTSRLASR